MAISETHIRNLWVVLQHDQNVVYPFLIGWQTIIVKKRLIFTSEMNKTYSENIALALKYLHLLLYNFL